MVRKGRTLTRRPWYLVTRGEIGVKKPMKSEFGHPELPRHFCSRYVADWLAYCREQQLLLEATRMNEYDPYAGFTIIW